MGRGEESYLVRMVRVSEYETLLGECKYEPLYIYIYIYKFGWGISSNTWRAYSVLPTLP